MIDYRIRYIPIIVYSDWGIEYESFLSTLIMIKSSMHHVRKENFAVFVNHNAANLLQNLQRVYIERSLVNLYGARV